MWPTRDRQDVDRRKRLAQHVLSSLDGFAPEALELLATGLRRTGGGAWERLSSVLSTHAGARADGETTSELAVLMLARWIRLVEMADGPAFERLTGEDADAGAGAPWAALREVLLEQREHVRRAA